MSSDPWSIRDAKGRERNLGGIEHQRNLKDAIAEVERELIDARAQYRTAAAHSPLRRSDGAPTSAGAKAAWDRLGALNAELGCLKGRAPATAEGRLRWYQRMSGHLARRHAAMPPAGLKFLREDAERQAADAQLSIQSSQGESLKRPLWRFLKRPPIVV